MLPLAFKLFREDLNRFFQDLRRKDQASDDPVGNVALLDNALSILGTSNERRHVLAEDDLKGDFVVVHVDDVDVLCRHIPKTDESPVIFGGIWR